MESKHKLICIVYYIVYLKENFLVDIEKDSLRKIKKHTQVISLFVYILNMTSQESQSSCSSKKMQFKVYKQISSMISIILSRAFLALLSPASQPSSIKSMLHFAC